MTELKIVTALRRGGAKKKAPELICSGAMKSVITSAFRLPGPVGPRLVESYVVVKKEWRARHREIYFLANTRRHQLLKFFFGEM
jgi:hypothetical protein